MYRSSAVSDHEYELGIRKELREIASALESEGILVAEAC
jgi:hypothetical protein